MNSLYIYISITAFTGGVDSGSHKLYANIWYGMDGRTAIVDIYCYMLFLQTKELNAGG